MAENYIAQASGLLPPNNRQVETATAHLLLRKAIGAVQAAPAAGYCEEALKILRSHMADRRNVSLHALHIFGTQMLRYIRKLTPTGERARRLREIHSELR